MEQNKENKERYGIIYKITNTVNGKCYIGQTTNKRGFNGRYHSCGKGIEKVYNYHKNNKEHNRHYNVHLLGAIEKYGLNSFTVDKEFDTAFSKEELDTLECKYIKEFDCINNGYNNNEGGSNGKHSEETCKKLSEKAKEIWSDPDKRRKISESMKGKKCGENNPNYGKHLTEDVRRKISEARKGKNCGENNPNFGNHKLAGENNPMYGVHRYGENNPMHGKQHSEDVRRKMSESKKGKYCGENNPSARKVKCITDGNTFNTLTECAEYYKLNINTIVRICKGITKKSRTGLVFMYYDEYLQQQKQQDQAVI